MQSWNIVYFLENAVRSRTALIRSGNMVESGKLLIRFNRGLSSMWESSDFNCELLNRLVVNRPVGGGTSLPRRRRLPAVQRRSKAAHT